MQKGEYYFRRDVEDWLGHRGETEIEAMMDESYIYWYSRETKMVNDVLAEINLTTSHCWVYGKITDLVDRNQEHWQEPRSTR